MKYKKEVELEMIKFFRFRTKNPVDSFTVIEPASWTNGHTDFKGACEKVESRVSSTFCVHFLYKVKAYKVKPNHLKF